MQQTVIFLTKKVSLTGSKELSCLAWMKNREYIAIGGLEGSLRVLILSNDNDRLGKGGPYKSFTHCEGHNVNGVVTHARWNEVYQKLATSDDSGLIIVWMNHQSEDAWFEEMINNRAKSNVVDMKWSNDGNKIAIAYEDGHIIVGTLEGSRLWAKEIGASLTALTWNGNDSLLLIGLSDGEVHAYDINGSFVNKVHMQCLENVDLTSVLSNKDIRKDFIVCMEWYTPTPLMRIPEPTDRAPDLPRTIRPGTFAPYPYVPRGQVPEDQPRFVVAYKRGVLQIMRHELDNSPQIVHLDNVMIVQCAWHPDGSILAVAGYQTNLPEKERNVIHFLTPYGEKIQTMRLSEGNFHGISWEGTGVRLGILIGSNFFLATVKLAYNWAYCGQTLVYTYKNFDTNENMIMFYETKMDEMFKRKTANVLMIQGCEDYCVVVTEVNEIGGLYKIEVCDTIGTPVDSTRTNLAPKTLSVSPGLVVIGSTEQFLVWHYNVPRRQTYDGAWKKTPKSDPVIYHIDGNQAIESGSAKRNREKFDNICCVCVSWNMILIGRDSCMVHQYSLPNVTLTTRYNLGYKAIYMTLNINSTRLAVISDNYLLKFFDIKETGALVVPNFEKREIWGVIWDKDRDDTLVCMEKQKVIMVHGTDSEEPIHNTGYLCGFTDLTVKCAMLDELMKNADRPTVNSVSTIETKSLRTAKQYLDSDNVAEAKKLIEINSHPKLWNLLATHALNKLDLVTAEQAFIKLQDYCGLQFLKKLQNIKSEALKKAEVCLFLGDFDMAEHICMENDRRDLAIEMRVKTHEWFKVLDILARTSGPGDDVLLQRAGKHAGDSFMERQKWQSAAKHYEDGQHYKELVECFVMMDDYARLEGLIQQLPEGNECLLQLAEIFSNAGLCNQAVESYLKLDMINEALDTCIRLNQWDKAVELSEKYKLSSGHNARQLLEKYVKELSGNSEQNLAAAQLYRHAAMYLEAAKIIFEITKSQVQNQASPQRLKKLYVMAGLMVEQYREHNKAMLTKKNSTSTATAALQGLLEEEHTLSMEDTRLIDTAWRGAEALHFLMLCHQQIYNNKFDAAMRTALVLTEYEDHIPEIEACSLLALTSCHAKYFSVCSKAFMKIESLNLATEEMTEYQDLALKIFLKHQPKDENPSRVECNNCNTMILDYLTTCPNPNCGTRFPICIASGRPLHDYEFWICLSCKHRAYEREVQFMRFCPLCHYEI